MLCPIRLQGYVPTKHKYITCLRASPVRAGLIKVGSESHRYPCFGGSQGAICRPYVHRDFSLSRVKVGSGCGMAEAVPCTKAVPYTKALRLGSTGTGWFPIH